MNIWFIWLGLMGVPMVKNILKNGFTVWIYNRTSWKAEELISMGATEYPNIQALATQSDILITMVTAWEDVYEVIFWEAGAIKWLKPNSVVIDMSTIWVEWGKKIFEKLKEKQIHFIDAPVTGSTPKAITGELTIFIGGESEVYERVKPVLGSMGTNLCYMWKSGIGQAMKLINNVLMANSLIGLAEMTRLAEKIGLQKSIFAETIKMIPVSSPYMAMKIDGIINDDFPCLFSLQNMKKDIVLATEEMKKWGLDLEFLKKIETLYNTWVQEWYWDLDVSAIAKVVKGGTI